MVNSPEFDKAIKDVQASDNIDPETKKFITAVAESHYKVLAKCGDLKDEVTRLRTVVDIRARTAFNNGVRACLVCRDIQHDNLNDEVAYCWQKFGKHTRDDVKQSLDPEV